MKKLALALVVSAFATAAQAQIAGGPHDFTDGFTGATFTATVGACTFCHAPHNANTTVTSSPLWNRPNNTGAYTMYATGGTIQGAIAAQPGANSLTCLACHDGTQAIAVVFGGANVGAGSTAATPVAVTVSADLRNDHPVGITYDPTADTSLKAVANVTGSALRLYNYTGLTNQVECGTCHDPHINTNGNFLRLPNTTALCSTCHSQ